MSPKLPRPVREADDAEKKFPSVPMWVNKPDAQVRFWPTGGSGKLPINTPVLRGRIVRKDFGMVALCAFNPPLHGLFTAGWIKLEDLSPAPVVVEPPAE